MIIYIGSDHRGFTLKEYIKAFLRNAGYSVSDLGNASYEEGDDYPDYIKEVAMKVSKNPEMGRGIVLCGSGVGADVVANKFPRVRCALAGGADQAFDSRNDDDSNMLALGANYLKEENAKKIVMTWLETPFSGEERHRGRIRKIALIEDELSGKRG